MAHSWPGNLRELSNFVKRYLILADEKLAVSELNIKSDAAASASGEEDGGLKSLGRNAKDEAEADAISRALDQTNWNRKQAAALLKISYKALLYKIRHYRLGETGERKLSAKA